MAGKYTGNMQDVSKKQAVEDMLMKTEKIGIKRTNTNNYREHEALYSDIFCT